MNVLWLQEQLARERAPISKVLGTRNSADLMTKNVDGPLMLEHLKRLQLESREGRSAKAAGLQSCARGLRVERAAERQIAVCENYLEGSKIDHWSSRGANGMWTRVHSKPRSALFTPCRVARGPARPDLLDGYRVTKGIAANGEKFEIRDDWRDGRKSHRALDKPWVGITTFVNRVAWVCLNNDAC